MSNFQSLPGFREFYPEDCAARNHLFRAWRDAARRAGFVEYDAPVLEPLELYLEKSGEEIRSQLFEFEDKGGRKVALRPEMTPSLARLVAAKAGSLRRPLKWFSIGEQFRYEKPQKGRLRSFYQFNADILGEPGIGADAECISLLINALQNLGLKRGQFVVKVSDRKLWFYFLETLGLNEEQIPSVLTIVDKWKRDPKEVSIKKLGEYFDAKAEDAWIKIDDFINRKTTIDSGGKLDERSKEWEELQNQLNSLDTPVHFDRGIVRGLAYYTGFVFEAFQTVGTARALAGGGRYDNLIQKLGGPDMPAVGFAIGDVTVMDLLNELNLPLGTVEKPDIYFVLGEGLAVRSLALGLVAKLRAANFGVDYPLKDTGFGKQFKAADQTGARLALILGADEVARGEVKIKDMQTGEESLLPNDDRLPSLIREKIVK